MKKYLLMLSILFLVSCKLFGQETAMLSNTKMQPEYFIWMHIREGLRQLNYKKCYEFMFTVRFELDKKTGNIKTLKFSENIVDTSIIRVVRKAFIDTQTIWILKNCKKQNPSLVFLLPIWIHIHNKGCIPMNTSDPFQPDYDRTLKDFAALITFPKNEYSTDSVVYKNETLMERNKTKFVGMLLTPINIGLSDGYD